jgi:hypothetical protein
VHHGLMGEQDNGRSGAGASDDPAAGGAGAASPTGDGTSPAPLSGSPVRVGSHRDRTGAAVRVGRIVQTIMNLLANTVRLVACLFAVVLVVRIGLAFVAVNPYNVIVEWSIRVSDVLVLDFRDLFLPSDPRIRLAVNYGLAAIFWLVAGMIVAWALSGLGRLAAGRPRF